MERCGYNLRELTEFRFYVPLSTRYVISETLNFLANLLAWYGKTKPNTTKAHIHQSKEMYNMQNKHKKLKSGLVASYYIQPILILALHKFVTYLLT